MMYMSSIIVHVLASTQFFELVTGAPPNKLEQVPQIAEATVHLNRVHPVNSDNYPSSSLLETCEARIPHYHVSRLRDTHQKHRGAGSSAMETDDSKALSFEVAIRMSNLKDSQYVGPLKVGSQG